MSFIINHPRSKVCSLVNNLSISRRCISSSKLTIDKTNDKSRFENKPKNEYLQFGKTISDHMLMIEWTKDRQWHDPKIVPYQDLKISPAATCLNYGTCMFKEFLFFIQHVL